MRTYKDVARRALCMGPSGDIDLWLVLDTAGNIIRTQLALGLRQEESNEDVLAEIVMQLADVVAKQHRQLVDYVNSHPQTTFRIGDKS